MNLKHKKTQNIGWYFISISLILQKHKIVLFFRRPLQNTGLLTFTNRDIAFLNLCSHDICHAKW